MPVSSFLLFAYLFSLPNFFVVISACYYDKLNFVSSAAHQFTNRDISLMLGVSQRTVERRITQLQMSNMSRYSNIEDDMLDSFVQRDIVWEPGYDLLGVVTSQELHEGVFIYKVFELSKYVRKQIQFRQLKSFFRHYYFHCLN